MKRKILRAVETNLENLDAKLIALQADNKQICAIIPCPVKFTCSATEVGLSETISDTNMIIKVIITYVEETL
jgi:hypothetical protein